MELDHVELLGLTRGDERPQLLGPRELAEIAQAEIVEELARRAIEQRPADDLGAAANRDQIPLHQRGEHRARVHAANGFDLALRDRLLVGDDRHRLQRRARQPGALASPEQAADPLGVLRRGDEQMPARDLAQLDARLAALVLGIETLQGLRHLGRRSIERFREQGQRQRLVRGEEQRLERGPKIRRGHGAHSLHGRDARS